MNNETTAPALDENQIIAERRAKLAAIRETGVAFPNDFERRDYAGKLAAAHGDKSKEALEAEGVAVQLAGRMMLKRDGQGELRHAAGHERTHPGVHFQRPRRR